MSLLRVYRHGAERDGWACRHCTEEKRTRVSLFFSWGKPRRTFARFVAHRVITHRRFRFAYVPETCHFSLPRAAVPFSIVVQPTTQTWTTTGTIKWTVIP